MADGANTDNLIPLTAETEPLTPKQEFVWRYLLNRLSESETQASALTAERNELQRRVNNLEKIVYGPKTEKTGVVLEGGEPMNMFDEAETESDEKIVPEKKSVKIAAHTRKEKATHKDTFEGLPVEEVIHRGAFFL